MSLKSIVSSIGSGIKKAATTVYKSITSTPTQTASAISALNSNNPKSQAVMAQFATPAKTVAPQIYQVKGNQAIGQNNSNIISVNPDGSYGTTYYNAQGGQNPAYNQSSTSSTISSGPSGGATVNNTPININSSVAADTLSAGSARFGTFGASSSGGASAFAPSNSGLAPSEGGSQNSAPSTGFPSTTPKYTDVGAVNLGGTASALTGMYALNPQTGQLEPVTTDVLAAERKKTAEDIKKMIPQKENISDNSQIQADQAIVDQRKQEVQNYTSQLNSIVAKQNADLLQLRGTGAAEGVTEAVYGGQQAEINREAAIKALPVQAQIAAAQGNLQLAQEHLTDLTKIISENIDNAYNYKKAQFDWAAQYATGEDKIKLEDLRTATSNALAQQKDAVNFAQSLMLKAIESGQGTVAASIGKLVTNPGSPTFVSDLNKVAAKIVPKVAAADKPSMSGQTLNLGSDPKIALERAADLEKQGVTSSDIVSLQNYLRQGYSLEQVAKTTGMPSNIQAAFSKYISVPKLGSGLE